MEPDFQTTMHEKFLRPEEILHALLKDGAEAVVRWLPDGTRVAVNAACARRCGCAASSLIGKILGTN